MSSEVGGCSSDGGGLGKGAYATRCSQTRLMCSSRWTHGIGWSIILRDWEQSLEQAQIQTCCYLFPKRQLVPFTSISRPLHCSTSWQDFQGPQPNLLAPILPPRPPLPSLHSSIQLASKILNSPPLPWPFQGAGCLHGPMGWRAVYLFSLWRSFSWPQVRHGCSGLVCGVLWFHHQPSPPPTPLANAVGTDRCEQAYSVPGAVTQAPYIAFGLLSRFYLEAYGYIQYHTHYLPRVASATCPTVDLNTIGMWVNEEANCEHYLQMGIPVWLLRQGFAASHPSNWFIECVEPTTCSPTTTPSINLTA